MAPSLASWSKAADPDQLGLSRYLEPGVETASPYMTVDVPLALDMCVGLPVGLPLTGQRDLDNYMQPVAAELGDARFDDVFGSKGTRTTRRWPLRRPSLSHLTGDPTCR